MPKAPENLREFAGLLKVVEFLRGPDGCPWDKEQTHSTLTRYAIEEAFELGEAIDSGDVGALKDELGDLLLQVVLHSEIARQDGRFDIFDVIQNLNEKMVRRHPHVFADVKVRDAAHVVSNWNEIKAEEKARKAAAAARTSTSQPLTFDIPVGLPALIRSQKIGEKTRKVGFDWDSIEGVWDKVKEEFAELSAEMVLATAMSSSLTSSALSASAPTKSSSADSPSPTAPENLARIREEMGDLLFSIAQLARHLDLDSEQALRQTNQRFEKRFFLTQKLAADAGHDWSKLSTDEKEKFWQAAKKSLK